MADPILAAIRYADNPHHQGAGYTLRITDTGGLVVEVEVSTGSPYFLTVAGTDRPLFVNPANIATAEVLW